MKLLDKKILAGLTAGAVLLAGGTFAQFAPPAYAAEAAYSQGDGRGWHQGRGHRQRPELNKEEAAERMAKVFGLNKDEVLSALNGQRDFRDVGRAAMLAKASGKSFGEVLSMKTDSNSWRDVESGLGVTQEKIRETMNEVMAAQIAERGSLKEAEVQKLLKNGYYPHDIGMAGAIAKESGKDVQSVLDMKKINNTWQDVAKSLGVDMKKVWKSGGHGFFGGPGMTMGGPMGGGPCLDGGEPPAPKDN